MEKKNHKIVNRVKLLMNYDSKKTLNENIDEIGLINEQGKFEPASKEMGAALKGITGAERKVLQGILDGAAGGLKSSEGVIIKSVDDLQRALEAGKVSEAPMGTIRRGLLRDASVSKSLKTKLIDSLAGIEAVQRKYAGKSVEEIKNQLTKLKNPYSPEQAEEIANAIVRKRGGKAGVPPVGKDVEATKQSKSQTQTITGDRNVTAQAGRDANVAGRDLTMGNKIEAQTYIEKQVNNIEKATITTSEKNVASATKEAEVVKDANYTKSVEESKAVVEDLKQKPKAWDKIKNVAKRLNKKWLWALGILGGGYLVYRFLFGKGTKTENTTLSNCMTELAQKDGVTVSATSTGDPVIMVSKTGNNDYDSKKGVKFYHNGRVSMGDNSKMGSWTCKGGQLSEQDSPDISQDLGINSDVVDILSDVTITWDAEKQTGGGSDNTTPTPKKQIYHDCSNKDFPYEFGCINPKIADIQKCLGVEPTKGYFGPKTLKSLGENQYDVSNKVITKELYDQVMSKCGGEKPVTTEPTKTEPAPTEPTKTEPTKTEPTKTEPTKTEPTKTEPTNTPSEESSDGFGGLTGQQIYSKLKENFRNDKTYPFVKARGGSIVLKGDIDVYQTLPKLDEFIKKAFGMTRDSEGAKKVTNRYGEKFVWSK